MFAKLLRVPRWIITTIFFALVAVFLVIYLRHIDWQKIADLSFNWWWIIASVVTGLLFRYEGVHIWRVILRALGATKLPKYPVTADVYAQAWMGRYIPGTVTWIAGKVYLASHWGISKSRLTVASLLEGGAQVAAITFVSFILLGADARLNVLNPAAKIALLLLGVAVLIVLVPRVFNAFVRFAYTTVRRREVPGELNINGTAVVRSFLLYCVNAVLSGVSCFLIIKAIDPGLAWHNLSFVIGAFGLASVAGMAAPFAPSGLGIRDGLQLVLLTAIMPKETALAATILVRLWSTAVDFLFFGATRPALARAARVDLTRIITFIASRTFRLITFGWLAFSSLWVALGSRYPMAFDEQQHVGVSELYAHNTWLPFFTSTPPNSSLYGAVQRDPSFLYHYLLSFPYRAISLLTDSLEAHVIILRILNVALFMVGLALSYKLLAKIGIRALYTNILGLFFVLLPVVSLLSSQVSYDNLMFVLTAWILLLAVDVAQKFDAGKLTWVVLLGVLASMVKYPFLPILAALVVFMGIKYWRVLGTGYKTWWLASSTRLKVVVLACTTVTAALFVGSYGVNVVKYHDLTPRCDLVMSVQECSNYGPWQRDYWKEQAAAHGSWGHLPVYIGGWMNQMLHETVFEVTSYFDHGVVRYWTDWPTKWLLYGILWPVLLLVLVGVALGLKRSWQDIRLRLVLVVVAVYTGALFATNWQNYLSTNTPVAIHGRYLVPLLLPLLALSVVGWQRSARVIPRLPKVIFVVALFVVLFWWGSLAAFIRNSDDSWFWQGNTTAAHVNAAVRKIL